MGRMCSFKGFLRLCRARHCSRGQGQGAEGTLVGQRIIFKDCSNFLIDPDICSNEPKGEQHMVSHFLGHRNCSAGQLPLQKIIHKHIGAIKEPVQAISLT